VKVENTIDLWISTPSSVCSKFELSARVGDVTGPGKIKHHQNQVSIPTPLSIKTSIGRRREPFGGAIDDVCLKACR
jgi:hypothetical protein